MNPNAMMAEMRPADTGVAGEDKENFGRDKHTEPADSSRRSGPKKERNNNLETREVVEFEVSKVMLDDDTIGTKAVILNNSK